jgi:hypothetical protein
MGIANNCLSDSRFPRAFGSRVELILGLCHPRKEFICGSPTARPNHSNRALSGWVMRFNNGIAANTTSADKANPPSMVM